MKLGEVQVNNSISKNTFRIIYIIVILIACLMLYVSLSGFIKVEVLRQSTKAEGVVTTKLYTPRSSSRNPRHYRVEFEYEVNSNKYTVQEDMGDKVSKYDIGERIKIYYDNDNVSKAKIYRIAYLPLCFSVILLIITTLIFIKSEKRN